MVKNFRNIQRFLISEERLANRRHEIGIVNIFKFISDQGKGKNFVQSGLQSKGVAWLLGRRIWWCRFSLLNALRFFPLFKHVFISRFA